MGRERGWQEEKGPGDNNGPAGAGSTFRFPSPCSVSPQPGLWGPRGQGGRRVTCPGRSPEVPKGDAEITSIPRPSAGEALVSGRTWFQPDLSMAQQRWLCRGQVSGTRGSPGFYFHPLILSAQFGFTFTILTISNCYKSLF